MLLVDGALTASSRGDRQSRHQLAIVRPFVHIVKVHKVQQKREMLLLTDVAPPLAH